MANWKATENGSGERKYHPEDVISYLLKDPGASVVLADSDGSDVDILTTKHDADSESEVDRSLSESDEEESFFFSKLLGQDAAEEGTAGISSLLLTPTAAVEPVSDEEESSMQVRAVDAEETARTSPAMTPASVSPTAGKSLHATQRSPRTAATASVTPARDPSAPRTPGLQLGRRAAPSRWVRPLSASSSDDIDSSDSEFRPPPKRKAVSRPASKGNRGDGGATATSQSAGGARDEERWHDREIDDEEPEPLTFKPHRPPGPTIDRTTSWTPLSLFQLFFSHSVMLTLIKNTNSNAAKRIASGMKFAWKTLTLKEFYTFLAIVLFSGLVHVHHRADLWKKQYPYNFKFPGDRMSRNRWESIMWSLHLSNPDDDEENTRKKGTSSYDRLFKIKPLYTEIVSACQSYFQPYQNIAIDERMVASKARVHFKQYMKNKPAKWGFKLYVLADSSTAYTWNFFVYSGKSESEPVKGKGLSYTSVMDLLPFGLLGTGYKLFVDNFYTSPALFRDLAERKFGCCGTIRKDHVGLPKTTVNDLGKKAERGDLRWIRKDSLLFVKWMDSRQVNICSSLHKAYSGQTARRLVKAAGVWSVKDVPVPDAILDYNVNMGGVDLSDALIGYYSVHHKTMKWYKTFFFHFLDIAVVNGFLLHKELCKIKRERPLAHKVFAETLIREMIEFSHGQVATELEPRHATCMPVFYGSDGSESRRYCAMCKKTGRGEKMKTPVYCRRCEVALCSIPKRNCFVEWHDSM